MTDCAWEGPGFTRCARASSFVSRIRPDEYQWAPGTGSVKSDATTNGIAFWAWISKIHSSRGISIYPSTGGATRISSTCSGENAYFCWSIWANSALDCAQIPAGHLRSIVSRMRQRVPSSLVSQPRSDSSAWIFVSSSPLALSSPHTIPV